MPAVPGAVGLYTWRYRENLCHDIGKSMALTNAESRAVLVPRQHLRADIGLDGTISAGAAVARLRLHRNERLTSFAGHVHDAMLASISGDQVVLYPDATEVISTLSLSLGIRPTELALFAGSESAIRTIFDVMAEPGDVVVSPKPSYHGYSREAFAHRATMSTVGYDADLRLDVAAVLDAAAGGPRVFFLGNPDGLGRPMPRDLVLAVLGALEPRGGLLVVDEAYHYFGAPSVRDLIGEHPQLLVLRTFSKAWGLAGVRCGYSVAHETTTRLLRRVRLRNEVSGLALAVVNYVLQHPELRDDYTAAVAQARDALSRQFGDWGFEVVPSTANFVVMRLPAARSVVARAAEAGIAIAALSADLIRVTVGPIDQMRPVIGFFQAEARTYSAG